MITPFWNVRLEYAMQLRKRLQQEKSLSYEDALKEEFAEVEHMLKELNK